MGLIQRAKEEVARQPAPDPLINEFVLVGEQYVARHMQWLLATGLVTTASSESAADQVDTAQVVSQTRTFSNAIPAVIGLGSLVVIVALVAFAKVWPAGRRRKATPAARRRKATPAASRR